MTAHVPASTVTPRQAPADLVGPRPRRWNARVQAGQAIRGGQILLASVLATVLASVLALVLSLVLAAPLRAEPVLPDYLTQVAAGDLVPGAGSYGPIRDDLPVAPVLKDGAPIGWAFVTSDFVSTTGYSGKPIDTLLALDPKGVVIGARLVRHHEPIVLVGIPEAKVRDLIAGYVGRDLAAAADGTTQDLQIISGATVTVMVIDDSIRRAGLRVARALGLGGLAAEAASTGPMVELNPDAAAAADWTGLVGDGTIRRLSLDVAQVNDAFAANPDPRAAEHALTDAPETTFIDMYATLVSIPQIGAATLGDAEEANLRGWLRDGDQALLVAGRGLYSFKGSGYVRGGIFDRIQLIQNDLTLLFHDRDHRRLSQVAVPGAPALSETDLFRIPADSGFDPTQPWRLQLLVNRSVGARDKVFTTFDLGWQPPPAFLRSVATPPVPAAVAPAATEQDDAAAARALWQRIWWDKRFEVAGLAVMLAALTAAFFFQGFLTRSARATTWFRTGFLLATLVFLGWHANAQLSVVNLMTLLGSLRGGFTWDAFLMDPLTFILWFSVAAALIFWGRGAYCGWLCPFGALQELSNRVARMLKVPQWTLPWGLHERLWAVKYIIFLGLFGVTLASMDQAERLAEVEPFKTAIVLKFARAWPFTLYALTLLGIGLFVERFYCRYLCPLGAALAIPARIRMFDWLRRYHECGNPCRTCAVECPVQSIHPTGEINPNECVNCMNCQVLYQSTTKCPVVIKTIKRRDAVAAGTARLSEATVRRDLTNHPNLKGKIDA
ncbi:NosR/NirI family protein [Rubellimicrobium arenae]|uniref:NosR/NirI family protein n=1 Tax=Rubellimicrobium arenae TaxID=2817372 RepID=UPI001B3059BE|nr:NosR/NirI family protein [Rubellimicrobium arenae]